MKEKGYGLGYAIGKAFKRNIHIALSSNKKFLKNKNKTNLPKFRHMLNIAKRKYPEIFKELEGMSDASNSNLDELMMLNILPEYEFGCSTLAYVDGKKILLAHNEDGDKYARKYAYFLKVKNSKENFISFCYPGSLPGNAFWFNKHGIFCAGDNVKVKDLKTGIPRIFIIRSIVGSKNLKDAISRATIKNRASGFSYNIGSIKENKLINLEVSASKFSLKEINSKFFRTNHFLHLNVPYKIKGSSKERYKRGEELLKSIDRFDDSILLKILSDRKNKPYSIYIDGKDVKSCTICTALFKVKKGLEMKVYPFGVRKGKSISFTLKDLD